MTTAPIHGVRKRIRLHETAYRASPHVFSVTICTLGRRPILTEPRFANASIDTLRALHEALGTPIWAFCLMPDHAHLLLGANTRHSLIRFVGSWKSITSSHHASGPRRIWQRSFYDHALRSRENVNVVALYILNNPVRAGFVQHWRGYPFSGSFELDL